MLRHFSNTLTPKTTSSTINYTQPSLDSGTIITINRISIKPTQSLNPLDLLLLSFIAICHIPTTALRITPHHLESSFQIFQQPMRNASGDDNHISPGHRFFYAAWIVLLSKAETCLTVRNAEDFMGCCLWCSDVSIPVCSVASDRSLSSHGNGSSCTLNTSIVAKRPRRNSDATRSRLQSH